MKHITSRMSWLPAAPNIALQVMLSHPTPDGTGHIIDSLDQTLLRCSDSWRWYIERWKHYGKK
jgi:hypothetical protein